MDIISHYATNPGLPTGICTIFRSINIRARLTYTISGSNMNDLWERNLKSLGLSFFTYKMEIAK